LKGDLASSLPKLRYLSIRIKSDGKRSGIDFLYTLKRFFPW